MMRLACKHTSSVVVIVSGALLALVTPCSAQQIAINQRVVLEARAARADSAAVRASESEAARAERRAEAAALRTRLRDGDFHVGDRITLWVNGETSLSGTFTVRAGNVLVIPSLSEISLQGVLRSELKDVLFREISRYIKQPEIQVTTLENLTILGAIGRPGFFAVAPDAPVTDVLMTAGGPTANADLGRSRVIRDGAEVIGAHEFRRLVEANKTLDEIGIQSGDQIVIGENQHRWQMIASTVGVVSLLIPIFVLTRHH